MHILKSPNLPDGRVALAALGESYFKRISKELMKYKIFPAIIKGPGYLPVEIRDHPDINLRHVGRTIFALEGTTLARFTLEQAGFDIKEVPIKDGAYPSNACLNTAIIGTTAIHNFAICAPALKKELCRQGITLMGIKQGYCACGTAIIDENSIITSDEGIVRAALSLGLDVLKISPGYIALPGYEYGFIGGCCGKLSKNILAFTGNLDNHPDKDKILNFVSEKEISPVFLTNEPLFDIGGIIPLCEI